MPDIKAPKAILTSMGVKIEWGKMGSTLFFGKIY